MFLDFGTFNISISLTFCFSLLGFSISSINKLSTFCNSKGFFSLGEMNILLTSSIIFFGKSLGALNNSIVSALSILLSGLNIPSITIESINLFFNGFFSFGGINILSLNSIILFSFLEGFTVLKISILSLFSILFSGISTPSISKLSHVFCFKGSFSFGTINKLWFASIIFLGFGVLNISILSTFCILLSGFKFPSINILSTTCPLNGSFSFSWDLINMLSFSSITFCGTILEVLIISNLLTFCILLSGWVLPSIKILSIIWPFNGIFTFEGIKTSPFSSITRVFGFIVFNISILFTFSISFSGFLFPSIKILSIIWLL